jgi:hypothetical protein
MPRVVDALGAFTERFPTVPPRVYVQALGAAAAYLAAQSNSLLRTRKNMLNP